MLRTALLGGNSITLDADMSKYIETVSDQGVIEGLEVSSGSVAAGKAWVKATRSNGETIMVLVQNTEALAVDASGTKKIWLEIKQEAIDNGALNNEDGTGIASIKTGPTLPSQNSLLLASVNNGRVEDERNLIPKIQSVAQRTTSLEEKMETQEQKVEKLEEAGTPSYLGITGIVGEKYTMEDVLFLQKTPSLEKSSLSYSIGNTDNNKAIHIQRIASGIQSKALKLNVGKFGTPAFDLIVEVRRGVKESASSGERWHGGGEVLGKGIISPSSLSEMNEEKTIILDRNIQANLGDLLCIVLSQKSNISNPNHFYTVGIDEESFSDAFGFCSINGNTKTYEKKMVYADSPSFLDGAFVKKTDEIIQIPEVIDTFNYYGTPRRGQNTFVLENYALKSPKCLLSLSWATNTMAHNLYLITPNGEEYLDKNVNKELHFRQGTKISLVIKTTDNSTYPINVYNIKITNKASSLTKKGHSLKPSSIESVGKKTQLVISGFDPSRDNIVNTIITQSYNSATTGTIPIGNVVGYIGGYLDDGTEIRIPYLKK